jgi:hypothetical protein
MVVGWAVGGGGAGGLTAVFDGRVDLLQVQGTGSLVATVETQTVGISGPGTNLEGELGTVGDGLHTRDTLGAANICGRVSD